jgi:hypothetical protein
MEEKGWGIDRAIAAAIKIVDKGFYDESRLP